MQKILSEKWRSIDGCAARTVATVVFWCVVLVYLLSFGYNCLYSTGTFSPDSVVYINVVQNLAAHRGLSLSAVYLYRAIEADAFPPRPLTEYNPVYPIVAWLLTPYMNAVAAALVVTIVFYAVFLVFAHILMHDLYGRGVAMLSTAALLHFAPLSAAARHAWSETLALACLAALLFALVQARRTEHRALMVVAGLAAGLAFDIRFALAPTVVLGPLFLIKRQDARQIIERGILFTGGFCILAVPVLVRKYLYAGYITSNNLVSRYTYFGAAREIASHMYAHLWPNHWLAQLVYLAVLLMAGWFLFRAYRARTLCSVLRQSFETSVLPLWVACYAAFFFYCCTHMWFDPVDYRLVLPATAFFLIFLVALITSPLRSRFSICLTLSLFLAGLAAQTELETTQYLWNKKIPPVYDPQKALRISETLAWLSSNVEQDDLVVAEDASDWPLFLGPMHIIYFFHDNTEKVDAAEFHSWFQAHRSEFQRAYLVLPPNDGSASTYTQGEVFREAFTQQTPVVQLNDGLVFRME